MVMNIFRFLVIFGLAFPGTQPNVFPRPETADWCQCVIFVLNYMGIHQIPGEYWTASSLAIPDETGKTWMDYQGFTRLSMDENPVPGDLLVISAGGEVITAQIWDGVEHAVPVPVDFWAGHIGIVEDAQKVEKFGQVFLQISLLSANWGVNARPAGVVGSCYNVDESVFLVPVGYKKAQFFRPSEPVHMRQRIINRASRWSNLGLMENSQTTLDGFPVTPTGFISAVLQAPSKQPLAPSLIDLKTDFTEIYINSVETGDTLQFKSENREPGYGIIFAYQPSPVSNRQVVLQVISMQPGGRVSGPEVWKLIRTEDNWIRVNNNEENPVVKFFRYNQLPGYPAFDQKGISWVNDAQLHASMSFSVMNAGGKDIEINNLHLQAQYYAQKGDKKQPLVMPSGQPTLVLKAGEIFTFSYSVQYPKAGEYQLDIFYEWNGEKVEHPNAALIGVR